MRTHALTHKLFSDFFTNWDRALIDEDYTYWRRDKNAIGHREQDNHHEYYIALAGYKKSHIQVKALEGRVFIVARKGKDKLSYSFELPQEIDLSTLFAKHEDGLLTIKIDKTEKEKPKNIKIN